MRLLPAPTTCLCKSTTMPGKEALETWPLCVSHHHNHFSVLIVEINKLRGSVKKIFELGFHTNQKKTMKSPPNVCSLLLLLLLEPAKGPEEALNNTEIL